MPAAAVAVADDRAVLVDLDPGRAARLAKRNRSALAQCLEVVEHVGRGGVVVGDAQRRTGACHRPLTASDGIHESEVTVDSIRMRRLRCSPAPSSPPRARPVGAARPRGVGLAPPDVAWSCPLSRWPRSRPANGCRTDGRRRDHRLPRRRQPHRPRRRAGAARPARPTSRSSAWPRTTTSWSPGPPRPRPRCVVTDIRMPPSFQREGIEAAKEVRKRHPGTGVVILSQYDDPEYAISLLTRARPATPTC